MPLLDESTNDSISREVIDAIHTLIESLISGHDDKRIQDIVSTLFMEAVAIIYCNNGHNKNKTIKTSKRLIKDDLRMIDDILHNFILNK